MQYRHNLSEVIVYWVKENWQEYLSNDLIPFVAEMMRAERGWQNPSLRLTMEVPVYGEIWLWKTKA